MTDTFAAIDLTSTTRVTPGDFKSAQCYAICTAFCDHCEKEEAHELVLLFKSAKGTGKGTRVKTCTDCYTYTLAPDKA